MIQVHIKSKKLEAQLEVAKIQYLVINWGVLAF